MDEILQILREEEATLNLPIKTRMDGINPEAFYCKRKNEKQTRLCYICRKSNHLAKDCYYRNKNSPSTGQRNYSSRNGHVFTASHREEKLCDNIWILDSGASCHMAKESVWFKNISYDIYLADKNSKMMSQGTGNVSAKTVSTKHCNSINLTITDISYVPQLRCNLLSVTCLMDKGSKYENLTDKRIKKIRTHNGLEFVNEQLDTYLANSGIFHEKTIPYNSESNGKAERANRVLLESARSVLYEKKLPLKFWAEAINCSTQVSNVTPRKGKEKIPLEIWTGNKPKLHYLKKFGCVAYFHVPKVLRNKFEVPGRRGIILGYARERRGYRIYDNKNQKVIEERSVKFNEYLKGSNYLGEIENETWDIDSFFEVSPERNEINQNTKNGVLYNFDINNGPGAIENDNPIPLQTTSSSRTGRIQIPVLELNDVQNQIPVRRSERLKSKLISVHLVNNVPNSYFEAENSANWKNWKLAMENELDSLDKHKIWEIVQKPAKSKLIKTKWSYSPVVNIESFRLLIALAAKLKLNVNFFDVKTAYSYGDLEETVYVLPPPGYEKLIGDDKVRKLKKSIYGSPQSGRNWTFQKVSDKVPYRFVTTLITPVPLWIAETRHRVGERNVRCDPTPGWGKITSERFSKRPQIVGGRLAGESGKETSQLLDVSRELVHVWMQTAQADDHDCLIPTIKHGCGFVMIWAAVSWFSAGPIVTLKGKITKEKYREILADQILPMMQTLFPAEDGIFLDDNTNHGLMNTWLTSTLARTVTRPQYN
ncbi:retrovirus-related Pol polyprotein from transposon TNT 1-94 [Trichonephila clavipes]|nr:retrovirus-related Pol polyprotein from transposon TNT 1-94 [Trichonephila clavipes]